MPKHGHNRKTKKRKSWDVVESRTAPDTSPRERVDLNPFAFSRLIEQKGVDCCVYRTMYCPNVKSVDGAEHNFDCTACNGSGFIDFDPIKTKVFIQAQELDKMPKEEGFVDGNTVQMSFPIGVELQYFTRIDLEDFTDIFFQRVLRTEGSDVDVLKYSALRVNGLIDRDSVRYYADKDFKINKEGNIEWLTGGTKPADNTPYSIHYEAKQQYRATRAAHVNRFTQYKIDSRIEFIKMPEQWYTAKEFMPKREDLDGNELEQGPYDNHTIVEEN